MSSLILQLPAHARLAAQDAANSPSPAPGSGEYSWVLVSDNFTVQSEGRCAIALLPRANSVVAVLADGDVAFHAIDLPKAPGSRLRAALAGVLEEQLLDDAETVHLAVAPDARAGQRTWIAACDRAWLAAELQVLEQHGLSVHRVGPTSWPSASGPARVHVHASVNDELQMSAPSPEGQVHHVGWVTYSHSDGCATWPMAGSASRSLLPASLPPDLRLSAAAAMAASAEHWLGSPVRVLTRTERMVEAAQGEWNLRQFDLMPRHRGAALLRSGWRQFLTPAWRPARWGLAGLLATQLIGLNAWAWLQRHELAQQRDAMMQILRTTHPQVRAVLDAPIQMRRENEALRSAAGRAGDGDLEPLLAAAASAWPENLPVQSLRYEGQQLTLAAPGLQANQAEQMRTQLAATGWSVEAADGRIVLRRATAPGAAGGSR